MIPLEHIKQRSKDKRKVFKKLMGRLGKLKPSRVDGLFHAEHDAAFEEIDCLACANCCSTTSPIFMRKDVERIAKHLGMRPGVFEERYLHMDEDEDLVLNTAPCPFLGSENYCSIYEVRPKACREYPHTDRKHMVDILDLTLKNTKVCPAVFQIVEKINEAV